MIKYIDIKTNRARRGYVRATIHRFVNYSTNKIAYSFRFYNTYKHFDTYKELREYVESNYQLHSYDGDYHMPIEMKDFFVRG